MKRDITVWISLPIFIMGWILFTATDIPNDFDQNDSLMLTVFKVIFLVAGFRTLVLYFQTLIHGIKYAKEENRVAVVLGHMFLGPIMSYLYYISSRFDAKQAASNPDQLATEC
ncbi:MAG: hypothetical protein GY869_00030 [Planctomycetes bacterium]|nr:hypothetical protein [Planctomycetota bacterium]